MPFESVSIQEEKVEFSYLEDRLFVSFLGGSVLEPSDSLSLECRRDWIMIHSA
jgi:hypothetical protein